MSIRFNQKQQETFHRLKSFISEDEHNTFILKGYAGTGKTLLVQEFAKYLHEQKRKYMLLATTGRAAAVLRGKTGLETKTVHSALYIYSRVDGDHDDLDINASVDEYGQMRLVFEPNSLLGEDVIYIVDEASMLASEQLDNETSFAVFGSGNVLPDLISAVGRSKVIFVGDDCQLPPIGQSISPALDEQWFVRNGRTCTVAVLDEIMRADSGNDVLQIASEVRNAIGVPSSTKWIKMPARNRSHCTLLPSENDLFLEYYQRFLECGAQDSIAIAHSNKACSHLNSFFRRKLFGGNCGILEVGEILMVNQNNYLIPLTNGDFVTVLSLGEISERMGLKFQNIRLEHILSEREYEIKLAIDPLSDSQPNLNTDQQRMLMIDFSRRMKSNRISPNSPSYSKAMQVDPYLNSLRASYGYVVTCHKSQGGEWKEVFLFLNKSMYANMKPDEMRRWWYTAITRTKDRLYLHDGWWLS